LTIISILDELGVQYQREASPFKSIFKPVDFIVEGRVVVEVNGWGHSLDEQHRSDVKKYAAIKRCKFTMVVIDHTEIDSAKAVIAAALEAK
jgi:very-short-patch-repair endonuclease